MEFDDRTQKQLFEEKPDLSYSVLSGSMYERKNKRQHAWKEQTRKLFTKKLTGKSQSRRQSSHWGTFVNVVADVLRFKKPHTTDWFQLAGHKGTFREGFRTNSLLKQLNENEAQQYTNIQCDVIATYIPRFYGKVTDDDGKEFIELEDVLAEFKDPSVMDVKMGVRTYLEEDVSDNKCQIARPDLYAKMISVDATAPTGEEQRQQAITKLRYMTWRENLSSTAQLGFRIEAIKKSNDDTLKDFQRSKTRGDVTKHLRYFVNGSLSIIDCFLKRLWKIRKLLNESLYFKTHELIGTSLLFVYDKRNAGIWLIDFAKTYTLPMGTVITHQDNWTINSHEDGYLIGLNNLIGILQNLRLEASVVREADL